MTSLYLGSCLDPWLKRLVIVAVLGLFILSVLFNKPGKLYCPIGSNDYALRQVSTFLSCEIEGVVKSDIASNFFYGFLWQHRWSLFHVDDTCTYTLEIALYLCLRFEIKAYFIYGKKVDT